IAVFGLLGLLLLRALCEWLLVYFKVNETAVKAVSLSRFSASLLDEVKDAISDIAEEEEADRSTPAGSAAAETATPAAASRPAVRRTAKRTPTGKAPQ